MNRNIFRHVNLSIWADGIILCVSAPFQTISCVTARGTDVTLLTVSEYDNMCHQIDELVRERRF